jgi:integrase
VLDDITTVIDGFYQSIFSDGCKANTVIHYHALLSKAFKTAMKKEILRENPIEEVDRPKKNRYHATFYTVDEMLTLMEAFCEDPLDLPVQIAAYYGLRRSEVLGLKWDAIDFTRKTISIRHKVIEAEINGKFVPVGEDVLKTKSSFRTLPLIPEIEFLLLKEKEKQEMYRRLFKKSYCRDYLDYICVDQTGKLLRPNYVTEHFAWVIEKYDLKKIRFHDLRHTCASLLLSKGISMKQIQIWLGHSTFSTTADIYAHLDYSAQEESAKVMTGLFAHPDTTEMSI